MLARALRRELKARSPGADVTASPMPVPAGKLLVLSPAVDSYLDDVL